jgi:hypothetical protein
MRFAVGAVFGLMVISILTDRKRFTSAFSFGCQQTKRNIFNRVQDYTGLSKSLCALDD